MSFPANIRDHRAALLDMLSESFRDASKRSVMRTRGISMQPFLRDDDEVVIRATEFESIRTGQIVAFRAGEALVVHRVVAVVPGPQGRQLCEKGDNNMYMTLLSPERVLGVVTEVGLDARRVRLDGSLQRWIGLAVAVYGRSSVRAFQWAHWVGGHVLRRGSGLSRRCRRATVCMLQLPIWLLLGVARRIPS